MDARVPDSCTDGRAAGRRRGLPRRCGTSASRWPPASGCTSPGSSTCSTGTARLVDELLDLIARRPVAGRAAARRRRLPARSRRVYAVTHEGARHLDDVLARRTRISIEAWDRGVAAAPVVADLMAALLGWRRGSRSARSTHYLRPGRGRARVPESSPTTTPPRPPAWRPRSSRACPICPGSPGSG